MRRLAWGFGLLLVAQAAAAASWTLGNLPSCTTGHYGTAHTIGIFYDPTFLQYRNPRWRLKLTIPYVRVSGLPSGSLLAGGTVAVRSRAAQTVDAGGLGDIWLAAHYTAVRESGLQPAIVPYAKIQFGTASRGAGLGTGRNDYEAGLGFDDTIGTNVFPFAHVGYRVVGSPPGVPLRNSALFDGGVSIATSPRDILTAMYYGWARSEQPGYPAPADLILAWNINLTAAGSGLEVYADKGFSAGSPRLGGGIGGQIVF